MSSFQVLNEKSYSTVCTVVKEVRELRICCCDHFHGLPDAIVVSLLDWDECQLSDTDLTSAVQSITAASSPTIWVKQRQQMVESTHMLGLGNPPPLFSLLLSAGANVTPGLKANISGQNCGSIELVWRNPDTVGLWGYLLSSLWGGELMRSYFETF